MQQEKHIPLTCSTLSHCPLPILLGLSRQNTSQPESRAGCQGVFWIFSSHSTWAAGIWGCKRLTDHLRERLADDLLFWAAKYLCFHSALASLTASPTGSWRTATTPPQYLHLTKRQQINTAENSSERLM